MKYTKFVGLDVHKETIAGCHGDGVVECAKQRVRCIAGGKPVE